jgi:hypothetical protein
MSFEVETNIDQLVKTIRSDIQGMFGSPEMQKAGRNAYDIMYKNVRNRMKATGYGYDQSGDFQQAIDDEKNNYDKGDYTKNSMNIGFGYIEEGVAGLDDRAYMRQEQIATFVSDQGHFAGQRITMHLKAETQMPKWIVLEFGTLEKADPIPDQFKVNYTKRPDKEVMFGPSERPPSGLNKKIYAMISERQHAKIGNGKWYSKGDESNMIHNRHSGVRAGRFFRHGLEDAKVPVFEALGQGIEDYLNRINGE